MLRVPWHGDMAVWAVVGGTVLSVVAQIVATKALGEGVGRSARNDIWKDTSGGAKNVLTRGEYDVVRPDKRSGVYVNSVRGDGEFDCHRGF